MKIDKSIMLGTQSKTVTTAMDAMQCGHALDQILSEITLASPSMGPVKLMVVDLSDGTYRINLNIDDIQKLGALLPTKPGQYFLVAFPLVLPMRWKNRPPIFSTATKTIASLVNQHLLAQPSPPLHSLGKRGST